MLRTKLFKAFALVVLLLAVLSSFLGIRILNNLVIDEAQQRIRADLGSAWAIYHYELSRVETILSITALKEAVVEVFESKDWENPEVRNRLEKIRVSFGLDFLDLVLPDGQVAVRVLPAGKTGDYRTTDPAVASALRGEKLACMALWNRQELSAEDPELAERAFIELEDTPLARKTAKTEETRGMMMECAVPVRQGAQILGVVYGGILVNRNFGLVDRIQKVVFEDKTYEGSEVGTTTIFLDDVRISTTVRLKNGNRALGTRVSKKVADRVLDNAKPWVGEAVVVDKECLTAYEPIWDGAGRVIGMLYVGTLKKPFDDMGRAVILEYVGVSIVALLGALLIAYLVAHRLAKPIHLLVQASSDMTHGNRPTTLVADGTCHETDSLIREFNNMAGTLVEREERLKALNRSYMETLGFVSHELKNPVATMMNYMFLLKEKKLGPLTEKQEKAVGVVERNGSRLVEMVRHYLNLARIENGELAPIRMKVNLQEDVVMPLLETLEGDLAEVGIRVRNGIDKSVLLNADVNMAREVFENLMTNAIKYGRAGGEIRLSAETGSDFVSMSVWNEGEGIADDQKGALFQKFSRLNGTGLKNKGTGLGLFITKNIVQAHGGTVTVESKAGEWAEFRFTLPAWKE